MLKPLVPKFRPDLSVCLKDITEKQIPVKLKPIVIARDRDVALDLRISMARVKSTLLS